MSVEPDRASHASTPTLEHRRTHAHRWRVAATVLTVWLAVASAASAHDEHPIYSVARSRVLMGTLCTATVETTDTTRAQQAVAQAFDEVARLEQVMSSWRDDSELTRLNASGTEWFTCGPDLFAALDSSRHYAELTGGAFDPTIEPLIRAWDMRGAGRVPGGDEIARARAHVDWQALELDRAGRRARFTREGMGVDLGGIGKGIALDRCIERLKAHAAFRTADTASASNRQWMLGGVIDFGGELHTLGPTRPVMIADPSERLRPLVRIEIGDRAVSTSGQSERGVTVKGKHYGHILDPRTGRPVPKTGSVTVVAASSTIADGLDTALFVMGREKTAAFARARPEIGVLWLEPAGRTVRAWKWNLEAARPEAEGAVEWMP